MILIEVTAAIDADGTLQTFYLSEDTFITSATDTPAHTAFAAALLDPGSIGVHAYSDDKTSGGSASLETGEIVIANADGQFDSWINYGFDGRPIVIRYGTGGSYPAAYPVIFRGTMETVEASWNTMTIRLRDKQAIFDVPLLKTRYAGNNLPPNGFEGTANDIKGKVKPRVFGTVFQVPAVQVNSSKLIYQINDGAVSSIVAVYDRGGALTIGANLPDRASLAASTPGAGNVFTCLAEGLFMLGATPSGIITADVVQGAASERTVGQVLKAIAVASGLASSSVAAADVAALDAFNASPVGIWIDDEGTTVREAMDQVAATIGAWYVFDTDDTLRMGVLSAPAGTPVMTLQDFDTGENIERRPPRDNAVPVWRVTVQHTRLWNVMQPQDIVGSATQDQVNYLTQQTRAESASDSNVQKRYLLASDIAISSLFTSAAPAAAEASRQLQLQKVQRTVFEVPVPVELVSAAQPKFMDPVMLLLGRFGLQAGQLFRIIGKRLELSKKTIYLTVWG
ncbi:hypothetical protein [Pseudoduganella sp. RAF53_2]|uniref:hypothetical protein n=1 Tax=unclassified Pseudoduganella TaxID=2637179 RepID=UPI003F971C54